MHPRVAELLQRPQWVQRTPEWYARRQDLLTASDAASALDIPPYKSFKGSSRQELLTKKLDNTPLKSLFLAHGVRYEPEACAKIAEALGEPILEFGLLVHPDLPWLGASPDGVTHSGKMIEIKCPLKRTIDPGHVPHHYYPQVQIQLEVCDLDIALFCQYKPDEMLDITVVERDRAWFQKHKDALYDFWEEFMQKRKTHVPSVPDPEPLCLVDPYLYD